MRRTRSRHTTATSSTSRRTWAAVSRRCRREPPHHGARRLQGGRCQSAAAQPAGNMQRAPCRCNVRRTRCRCNARHAICNVRHATYDMQHAACSVQHDCPLSCRRRRQSAHNASPVYSTWTRYPRASRASPYILALWLHAPRVTAADQWALHMCRREFFATTSLSSSTSTPRHTRQGPVATAGRCQQRAVTAACAAPIHGGGH